jgi:hypothetical protein
MTDPKKMKQDAPNCHQNNISPNNLKFMNEFETMQSETPVTRAKTLGAKRFLEVVLSNISSERI